MVNICFIKIHLKSIFEVRDSGIKFFFKLDNLWNNLNSIKLSNCHPKLKNKYEFCFCESFLESINNY